jgi:large subunit ribosomal protein L11
MNQNLKPLPKAIIRLRLMANKASPSPILGQSLGQYGINIMDFCKAFNAKSKNLKDGLLVPVVVVIYNQNSIEIQIKTPSTPQILKSITGIEKGSSLTKKENFSKEEAFLSLKEIYHLALFKKSDRFLNHLNVKSLCKTLIGTARSIGIPVIRS